MNRPNPFSNGFTIVDLLIAIAAIATLGIISVVEYSNIRDRTYDVAVQNDLLGIGQSIVEYQKANGALPSDASDLGSMDLKVVANAYGSGYSDNNFNMAYCAAPNGKSFVLIAASKTGNVFKFERGVTRDGNGPMTDLEAVCANNGQSSSATHHWLYSDGYWQSFVTAS